MRILHTSDWHLGKTLDGFSRIEEQEAFVEELLGIVKKTDPKVIIIAGDIYDSGNPSARAENLFYYSIKKLSENGRRLVIVSSGNHDSPERLSSVRPLAEGYGIAIFGDFEEDVKPGEYDGFKIINAGKGFIEIEAGDEKAVFAVLPYPSEKRVNELFIEGEEEEEKRKSYSEKVSEIFREFGRNFRDDTINIAVSHLYIHGGRISDSERSIELGGSYAVDEECFPEKAQYVALGHLHKPQRIGTSSRNIYYAGSPLQYSKSEIDYAKSVYIIDVKAGENPKVEKYPLRNYKPIEVWRCESIEKAIDRCSQKGDNPLWIYLEIETVRLIEQSEVKQMRDLAGDIISITPIFKDNEEEEIFEGLRERHLDEMFRDFYKKVNGAEPTEELLKLFLQISEEDETDETEEA